MTDAFWTFQVPNLLIAMAMYSIAARFVLSLFMPPDSDKVIWTVFVQITEPVLKPVRMITPQIVPERLIYIFAFLWLFALRIVFYVVMRMYDLAPSIAG
jgi:YggT family protein